MQISQLNYYCYACETHFKTSSSASSCLRCDSNAIENSSNQGSSTSLDSFKPFELKNPNLPEQPEGLLENTVVPRQRLRLSLPVFVPVVYHRVTIIDLDGLSSTSGLPGSLSRLLSALLGETEEGVTQEEMQKLEKVSHVSECSICQECQQENSSDDTKTGFKLKCGHAFHEGCIRPWFEKARTCPLCRKSVSGEE